MDEKKSTIIKHIKKRITELEELGEVYSEEKINNLAENLSKTDKTIGEIYTLIDNKFSNQVRKVNHNNYLASLKEYYISSIDKLKRGNNCYLLSYDQGIKVLEQANVKVLKELNPYLNVVSINKVNKGTQKENSVSNDYELIMSDIAYLLNIDYAKTYRVFDKNMEPKGVININFEEENERFLTLEEALRFIEEESPSFTLTQKLKDYHDKQVRFGLKQIKNKKDYKDNIEYVIDLFKALPDITTKNLNELKKSYFNMKVFELLTNSLNNNLSNFGIIVNKESKKYTYRLSPSYNKYTTELETLNSEETICNFFIVNKRELLNTLIQNYYKDIKQLLTLIANNKKSLLPIISQIIKEHLNYDEYNKYYKVITDNIVMIEECVALKKISTHDTEDDEEINKTNDALYNERIAPFMENYVSDEYEEPSKGSTILTAIVAFILCATIVIVLLAIYAISKMNM
ncbi:MAG: hypothetical protein E7171_02405 [Firmicutes bacterium]|nr:hypothetical protein [Bacillota bacterium]